MYSLSPYRVLPHPSEVFLAILSRQYSIQPVLPSIVVPVLYIHPSFLCVKSHLLLALKEKKRKKNNNNEVNKIILTCTTKKKFIQNATMSHIFFYMQRTIVHKKGISSIN